MRTHLAAALLALAACADDAASIASPDLVDEALAPPLPPAVPLELAVSQIVATGDAMLSARSAPPGTRVWFIVSAAGAGRTCPPALGGHCVDLARPAVLGDDATDRSGLAELPLTVPANVADGNPAWFQAVAIDAAGVFYKSPASQIVTGPVFCPRIWAPECGTDGLTHANACELDAAGTFLAYAGPC